MKFSDGSARIKNYVCSIAGNEKAQLRVEFDSLSEVAAGSLVEATSNPDLAQILGENLGKWRAVRNDVFDEAKTLFDAYGTKEVITKGFRLSHRNVDVLRTESATALVVPSPANPQPPTIWYFRWPDAENGTGVGLPLPADNKTIVGTTHWPNGWRFYYNSVDAVGAQPCKETGFIGCTELWRPARASDLADYFVNRRADEAQKQLKDPEFDAEGRADDEKTMRYFHLVQHLNAAGWNADFLTVSGNLDSCGGGFDFFLRVRQMRLETAFVTNISSQPLSIDGLIGDVATGAALRASTAPTHLAASGPLPGKTITLAPGDTIAVALRILFVPAGGRDAVFQTDYLSGVQPIDLSAAGRVYQAIQSARPGTIFKDKNASDAALAIKKTRESFGPPSAPDAADFVWGPAIDLRGVTLNGQRVDFDHGAPNSFTISFGGEYGSCPYLYVFDANANAWVRHGKIIDKANSATKETTQVIEFAGLADRFSIREEELEVSYIRSVRLDVQLRGGRNIELAPREQEGSAPAASFAVIRSGEAHDYTFALPDAVAAADVVHSALVVRGYYQRYSSIPIARR